jgi:lauroyl/myristoyl acyltransferase
VAGSGVRADDALAVFSARRSSAAGATGRHRTCRATGAGTARDLAASVEETAARVVKVSGWDLVEAATRRGKGILYLTPHLGCFEITAQYLSTHAPITCALSSAEAGLAAEAD